MARHELASALLRLSGNPVGSCSRLPVIWWLLRLTPPKPQTEVFPPLRILARVLKKEETPHQSPWWLTLLRLLMAALIVAALAQPIWNPREKLPTGGEALALVIDNGWASAPDWDRRVATAERLIADANSRPVRRCSSPLPPKSPMPISARLTLRPHWTS